MNSSFTTKVYGKWILTGEHAVLRGHSALIFPIPSKYLQLHYIPSEQSLYIQSLTQTDIKTQFSLEQVLSRALEITNTVAKKLSGKITIESNIPIGAGMGSSAALCVAIMRLLQHLEFISAEYLFDLSRKLENMFHGESSGVDIAVAIAATGICFSRTSDIHQIKKNWQPRWYLSYSGIASATADSVAKVKALWSTDPKLAEEIDHDMATSVQMAEAALQNSATGLEDLRNAIYLGYLCFKRWGLCEGNVEKHIEKLWNAGALVAKPTGAGGGGYVLSLWDKYPPEYLLKSMILL